MASELRVVRAIARAEAILPGKPAPEGKRDPRWRAIIRVGEFIETRPEEVWRFAERWGRHAQWDLRAAVATCLLEHLLEYHFDALFPRMRRAALASPRFADAFSMCWRFGQTELPENAARFERLMRQLENRKRRRARDRARHAADFGELSRVAKRSGAAG